MDTNKQIEKFNQWLPFYLKGSLATRQQEWMERYLEQRPEAQPELRFNRVLGESLRDALPDDPPDLGLERLLARIRAEDAAPQKPKAARINFFQRLWLELSEISLSPLSAVTVILVVAQTGLIAALLIKPNNAAVNAEEYGQWRSPSAVAAAKEGPVLRMTFKSTATEGEIRYLLVRIRGSLQGGPGQLGNYLVQVPPGSLDYAKAEIGSSRIIESVDLVPDGALDR